MSHSNNIEHGIDNIEQADPSAALGETVDYNQAAEARAGEPANPQATALMDQHASMFGHDAARFGQVTNTEFTTIDDRTMTLDTTNLRNAKALEQAAFLQQSIDQEAEETMSNAESMVQNNSAEIPPGNNEGREVAQLDAGFEQDAGIATAEIASINGGVAEQMDNAITQV
jgi:hypothetical protein